MRIPFPDIPSDVRDLADTFRSHGFGLWVVGGYVRDVVIGERPKDLDLCTDANPDEQVAVYAGAALRHVPTGIGHGTVTAILASGPCEITSMRRDVTSDGRHAVVAYTRDRTEDQARRDLTMNAVSADIDGEVHDPFGGVGDALARRVRFVGEPDARMREDYLRILRWLRFQGRFDPHGTPDPAAAEAAIRNAGGLAGISRERVWSEVSRIVTGPGRAPMMRALVDLGLAAHLDLPGGSDGAMVRLSASGGGGDAALMMAAYLGYDAGRVAALAEKWRWSRSDAKRAGFVCEHAGRGIDPMRAVSLDGRPAAWAAALARADGDPDAADAVLAWDPPAFPIDGNDLAAAGVERGPGMRQAVAALKEAWADSGYALGRDELLVLAQGGSSPAP